MSFESASPGSEAAVRPRWRPDQQLARPYWDGYRNLLLRLSPDRFPTASDLNGLLAASLKNEAGKTIRFVPSADLPGVPYEQHIYRTGQVSTRELNWHDLFNALVWCRLPRLKVAMNALHYRNLDESKHGARGKLRDALTLFDESGVIVTGKNREALLALANRDWPGVFVEFRDAWRDDLHVTVCGHALLEKFLSPYKALTAHCLLLHIDQPDVEQHGTIHLEELDALLARKLMEGSLFDSPADLSPMPLMGIPGWWPGGAQNGMFYADLSVFRRPRPGQRTARLHPVRDGCHD